MIINCYSSLWLHDISVFVCTVVIIYKPATNLYSILPHLTRVYEDRNNASYLSLWIWFWCVRLVCHTKVRIMISDESVLCLHCIERKVLKKTVKTANSLDWIEVMMNYDCVLYYLRTKENQWDKIAYLCQNRIFEMESSW